MTNDDDNDDDESIIVEYYDSRYIFPEEYTRQKYPK